MALLVIFGFFTVHFLFVIFVAVRARRVIREFNMPSASAAALSMKIDRLFNRARWATILLTSLFLFSSPLPAIVYGWLDHTTILVDVPLVPELFFLSPAILSWLVFWTCNYYFESAARDRTFAYRLAQGLPTHEMPTLGQYLSMQSRHNFYVLVPVIALSLITLPAIWIRHWVPQAPDAAGPIGIVIVLLSMPWLLVRIWSTAPLEGPLRLQLDSVAAAHHLRFRNILLWKTHNAVTNAAILGWVPFSRYFLMTDALLESLTDRQIEAVFAHEVGHGVHRHIVWYLASFAGASSLAGGVALVWVHFLPPALAGFAGQDNSQYLVGVACGCLFLGFGFPLISHRFEHQADWFASRHMAHVLEAQPKPQGGGAAIFTAPISLLPPELQTALTTLPTAAETISVEQYLAGSYPHAGTAFPAPSPATANPTASMPIVTLPHAGALGSVRPQASLGAASVSASPLPAGAPPIGSTSMTPLQGGAEIFISALDAIVEVAHKSRERKGWMHPSVNQRIRLLRTLAIDPEAEAQFNARMFRTRVGIVLLVLAGMAAAVGGWYLDSHSDADTAPATQHSGGQDYLI